MVTKCFQLYLADEARSYASMSPSNASPIFLDDKIGRQGLWRYIERESMEGAFELDVADIDLARDFILYDDPLLVNNIIRWAVLIEWEVL